jgi:hypothetical protein
MIDYLKIARGVDYYSSLDYQYIEVPWLVSKDAVDITKPPESQYFDTIFGHLVGSGEQAFLNIFDHLERGQKYQCVTPCFRDDIIDELHAMWFMKLELIYIAGDENKSELEDILDDMVEDAWEFFAYYANEEDIAITETEEGVDIEINGIEVGSYGIRTHNGLSWVFGTGLAEPRMSQATLKEESLLL